MLCYAMLCYTMLENQLFFDSFFRLEKNKTNQNFSLLQDHWCGESTGNRWTPLKRVNDMQSVPMVWRHHVLLVWHSVSIGRPHYLPWGADKTMQCVMCGMVIFQCLYHIWNLLSIVQRFRKYMTTTSDIYIIIPIVIMMTMMIIITDSKGNDNIDDHDDNKTIIMIMIMMMEMIEAIYASIQYYCKHTAQWYTTSTS